MVKTDPEKFLEILNFISLNNNLDRLLEAIDYFISFNKRRFINELF